MAELTINDLPASTRARFASDSETQAALDAALVAARRYCGWHVSPVKTGDIATLDGPCGRVLDLPTRKLLALTAVTENGNTVDVDKLEWSQNGSVRKLSGASWSYRYRSIVATMTHGFTEAEAADWRKAIVTMIDAMVPGAAGENGGTLVRKRVDDVEYEWSDGDLAAAADRAVYSVSNVLNSYQLVPVVFA